MSSSNGMAGKGYVAAVDLGATSGRVMLASVSNNRIEMRPTGRFANSPLPLPDGMHWNLPGLYRGVLDGLAAAFREEPRILSVGIDSWAVDYGLLRGNCLLGLPFHYRDPRSHSGVDIVHRTISPSALYRRTGLQFLHFNTLYQLAVERETGLLDVADSALLIPDLLAFLLTGERVAERTNASTTGLLEVGGGGWDDDLLSLLHLDPSLFPGLVDPGSRIGGFLPAVAREITAPSETSLMAVASHDTASAVAATPLVDPNAAYISCGTWGLVGLELKQPLLGEDARAANFTNELGLDGRYRFLTNVMGLWLLSETIRGWEAEGNPVELVELLEAAAAVTNSFVAFDVNSSAFRSPGNVPARIRDWYRERDLPAPSTHAEVARVILESLAEGFAHAVRTAGTLADVRVPAVHIVGGGSLNGLLCQLVADRSGLPVFAGPVEATALGNALVQAQFAGLIEPGADERREAVRRSTEVQRFLPH